MQIPQAPAEGDISTLPAWGHFYFALTFLNRVVAVTGGVQYSYDASNRRIWKLNANGEAYYLYDLNGENLGTFTPQIEADPTSLYLQPVAWQERAYFFGKKLFVAEDNVGSALGVPTLTNHQSFYPYGEQKSGTAATEQYAFATYWEDSETGLDYAVNRYYSSTLGRFLSPDPYRANNGGPGDPTDGQSWNRYAYVGGDPVNNTDPTGQQLMGVACFLFWSGSGWVQSGNPEGATVVGMWGLGNLDCATASTPTQANPVPKCGDENHFLFVAQNYAAAAAVAAEADQDFAGLNAQNFNAATVLGWAAAETGYDNPADSPALRSGNGDYFDLTAGSNWINQAACPAGAATLYACFGTFQGAAEAALFSSTAYSYNNNARVSPGYVLGQVLGSGGSLATAFQTVATALHYDPKNPLYGSNVQGAVTWVNKFLNCLKTNYASIAKDLGL